MSMDYETDLTELTSNSVFQQVIASRQLGVIIWNLTKNNLTIYENFSEFDTESIDDLFEYIRLVAFEKDLEMSLQCLKNYLENPSGDYKSNFRIQTADGKIKWVLFKGKIVTVESNGNEILQILMYDVSGRNFEAGNDVVTNLLNRNYFLNKLEAAVTYEAPHEKHAVIGIRLHHIPDFNSSALRNAILREVSDKLLSLLKDKDELAKFPGERFFILIHSYKDQNELEKLTSAINAIFNEPIFINKRRILLDASIGVSLYPKDSKNAIDLISFAELAKRQSTHNQNNRITFFKKEFSERAYKNNAIEVELADALDKDEFYITYQLQVDSSTNKIIGVEALIRWENDTLGLISPDQFIPLAENNGHIINIGKWTLEEVIRTAKEWDDKGYKFGTVSVNVSPIEFLEKDFVQNLFALCKKYELPHSLLGVEVTEGIYLHNVESSLVKIKELLDNEIKISVDDFGTGYSNFVFLVQANMDTIKIDKSIIQEIENAETELLVRGIVNLGNDLNYDVIAEGVETKEQVELLSKLGLNQVQGFYYSKPVIQSEIEKLFKQK